MRASRPPGLRMISASVFHACDGQPPILCFRWSSTSLLEVTLIYFSPCGRSWGFPGLHRRGSLRWTATSSCGGTVESNLYLILTWRLFWVAAVAAVVAVIAGIPRLLLEEEALPPGFCGLATVRPFWKPTRAGYWRWKWHCLSQTLLDKISEGKMGKRISLGLSRLGKDSRMGYSGASRQAGDHNWKKKSYQ